MLRIALFFLLYISTLSGALVGTQTAQAELLIEITQGRDNPTSIAVVPFSWDGGGLPPEDVANVVNGDLLRSGQFSPVSREDMLSQPRRESEIYYRDWRALNVEYLVLGRIRAGASVSIEYELYDVFRQDKILSGTLEGDPAEMRMLAHRVSDAIYGQLTGIRGAFATRLLYVSVERREGLNDLYSLVLSDADGARPQVLLTQIGRAHV